MFHKSKICDVCGEQFKQTGTQQRRCPGLCQTVARRRVGSLYRQKPEVKAKKLASERLRQQKPEVKAYQQRYKQTTEYKRKRKEVYGESEREYRQSPRGKEILRQACLKWIKSPKGKAYLLRKHQKLRSPESVSRRRQYDYERYRVSRLIKIESQLTYAIQEMIRITKELDHEQQNNDEA